jgi:VanZ family protein
VTRLRFSSAWWALGWLALLTVTVASLLPLPADLPSPPGEDLTLHLIAWFVLSGWFGQLGRRPFTIAALLLIYSLAIEGLQSQLAFRNAELSDALANAAGAGLGAIWARLYGTRWLIYVDGRLSDLMARTRA